MERIATEKLVEMKDRRDCTDVSRVLFSPSLPISTVRLRFDLIIQMQLSESYWNALIQLYVAVPNNSLLQLLFQIFIVFVASLL